MLMVIRTGGIDLSVGSVLALRRPARHRAAGADALPARDPRRARRWALAVGWLNGCLIARFNLQPFIVTLATMGSAARPHSTSMPTRRAIPSDEMFRALIGGAFIGPVPVQLHHLRARGAGRLVLPRTTPSRAAPSSRSASTRRRCGSPASTSAGTSIFAYVACGFLAAIAGVLLASRLGIAQPSVGVGYELDAIAAVVIGGGMLGGGGGTALGVLGGVRGARASSTTCSTSSTSTVLLPAGGQGPDHPGGGAGAAQEATEERDVSAPSGRGVPKEEGEEQ